MRRPKMMLGYGCGTQTRPLGYRIEKEGDRFQLLWQDSTTSWMIVAISAEQLMLEAIVEKAKAKR